MGAAKKPLEGGTENTVPGDTKPANLHLDSRKLYHRLSSKSPAIPSGLVVAQSHMGQMRQLCYARGRNKHTKWHGRPAHVLTGETPVLRDG